MRNVGKQRKATAMHVWPNSCGNPSQLLHPVMIYSGTSLCQKDMNWLGFSSQDSMIHSMTRYCGICRYSMCQGDINYLDRKREIEERRGGRRHSPMLYFCWTSLTVCVFADRRKIPSVARAGNTERVDPSLDYVNKEHYVALSKYSDLLQASTSQGSEGGGMAASITDQGNNMQRYLYMDSYGISGMQIRCLWLVCLPLAKLAFCFNFLRIQFKWEWREEQI